MAGSAGERRRRRRPRRCGVAGCGSWEAAARPGTATASSAPSAGSPTWISPWAASSAPPAPASCEWTGAGGGPGRSGGELALRTAGTRGEGTEPRSGAVGRPGTRRMCREGRLLQGCHGEGEGSGATKNDWSRDAGERKDSVRTGETP